MPRQLRREDYTVGWVCALPIELAAAQEMLDEEHGEFKRDLAENDENLYALGSIGDHNVAIVCLPAGRIGNNPAAVVATQMRATFKGIRFGLMVGIGGGVPSEERDIRLGDVVVSQPDGAFGGVVQYDMGKATPSGFQRTGSLNSPPQLLLAAVARVRANEIRGKSRMLEHLSKLEGVPKFQRGKTGPDVLFEAAYDHESGQTCSKCSVDRQEDREPRESEEELVTIHYGTIASGNQVMRNATQRDRVSADLGNVLCFEMEAAGLMNSFPCLVVRGICDYADSHKNKRWQAYAAGTAAAWAKELLSVIPATEVAKTHTVDEALNANPGHVSTPTYYLPFSKNSYFVGRHNELNLLKQKLIEGQDVQKMSIVGLGGTGKTQVALQFAYMFKEARPKFSVFWMPALSMESYEQACASIAQLLHIPQVANKDEDPKELVQQHLSSARASQWLLVVDNADDPDILFGAGESKGIVDYLPKSSNGIVLYTTRIQEVAVSLTRSDVLELEAMSQQDAFEFLEKSLVKKDLVRNRAEANELLEELTCLPLAIAQAAAYLNRNRTTITKYLRLLRNTEQDIVGLMSREFRDETRYQDSANAVATTWVVSFAQIRDLDKEATDLLLFMSCIEWKAIPQSLLPHMQPAERMEQAIGTLCGYSFLTKRDDGGQNEADEIEAWYDMHRLVHLATRIWSKRHSDARKVAEQAMQRVIDVFPLGDYRDRAIWNAYLPHALRLLKDERLRHSHEEMAKLSQCLGRCLLTDGRFREAVRWLEESCRCIETLDEEDEHRLLSQHTLARAYILDGQVEKAVKLLEHVVHMREKLAEDDPDRLESQHELGKAYLDDGQLGKAMEMLERVVEVEEKLAEDDPSRLKSQKLLARIYTDRREVEKAIELLEHVVTFEARIADQSDPALLSSQHELARAYRRNGQVEKAIELLEDVVAAQANIYQDDHPNQLISQFLLAIAYENNGQVEKTIELLEYVVAVQAHALGEDHPNRLKSQHMLAVAYRRIGRIEKAVQLMEYVVAIGANIYRDDHESQLRAQCMLAVSYGDIGQLEKSIELLEHIVAVEAGIDSNDRPMRIVLRKRLALAYWNNNQAEEAIKLLEHIVTVQTHKLQDDDPGLLSSQHHLATVYEDIGQVEKAIEILEHLVTIEAGIYEESDWRRLESQYNLALAYQANGQVDKAIELLEHVDAVEANIYEKDDPDRMLTQNKLAELYEQLESDSQSSSEYFSS